MGFTWKYFPWLLLWPLTIFSGKALINWLLLYFYGSFRCLALLAKKAKYLLNPLFMIWKSKNRFSKLKLLKTVGAKRVFSQHQLLRNIDNTIIIISFSNNTTIIYWMKETNSCFFRIANKALVRIQKNLYTEFEWIWRSNLQNFIFSWRVLQKKMKIKVSSV